MNLITEIKDYWDNQPCNIRNSSSQIGTEQFFKETSENRYFVEPHIKDFAQFELYRGKKVLEIGCGIGADGAEFSKNGAIYTGIDISENSLSIAKKRFEVCGLQGNFYNISGDSPNLLDLGKFDLVYSFGVLHHYPNIENTIDNVHHLLNNDGEFKFMVYAKNSWKNAMIQYGLDQYEAQDQCPLANTYSKEEIINLLISKFNILSINQDHCFMYKIDDYKKRIYKLEPWFEAMPEKVREAIKKQLGWHLLVTAKIN